MGLFGDLGRAASGAIGAVGGAVGGVASGVLGPVAGSISAGVGIGAATLMIGPNIAKIARNSERIADDLSKLTSYAEGMANSLEDMSDSVERMAEHVSLIGNGVFQIVNGINRIADILDGHFASLNQIIVESNRQLADRIREDIDSAFYRQAMTKGRMALATYEASIGPRASRDQLLRALVQVEQQLLEAIMLMEEFSGFGTKTFLHISPMFNTWCRAYDALYIAGLRFKPLEDLETTKSVLRKSHQYVAGHQRAFLEAYERLPEQQLVYRDVRLGFAGPRPPRFSGLRSFQYADYYRAEELDLDDGVRVYPRLPSSASGHGDELPRFDEPLELPTPELIQQLRERLVEAFATNQFHVFGYEGERSMCLMSRPMKLVQFANPSSPDVIWSWVEDSPSWLGGIELELEKVKRLEDLSAAERVLEEMVGATGV